MVLTTRFDGECAYDEGLSSLAAMHKVYQWGMSTLEVLSGRMCICGGGHTCYPHGLTSGPVCVIISAVLPVG